MSSIGRWNWKETELDSEKVLDQIAELKEEHRTTWRDKSEAFWFLGLLEEVIELGLSLIGLHRGPVDWELLQISTICANWMEHRKETQ